MEIIFDDDDLEPLIRDMPIGSPHSGAEGERLEASSQEPLMKPSRKRNAPAKKKKTVVPSTPSLFEALDASGAAASAETSSKTAPLPFGALKTFAWQTAVSTDGSFVPAVGSRARVESTPVRDAESDTANETSSEAVGDPDPFAELLEETKRRHGRKDTSKPGSVAPRMIADASDVLRLFGKNEKTRTKKTSNKDAESAKKRCISLESAGEEAFYEPYEEAYDAFASDECGNEPLDLDVDRKKERPKKKRATLMQRAVASLARRDYSRLELKRKLARTLEEGETPQVLETVLDTLVERGLLSDERYAKMKARSVSYRMGDAKIRRELRIRGVDEETAKKAVEGITESEEVRAYKMWRRRFDETPKNWKEREKQIRYLAYRGFSMSSIMKVLRGEVELPQEETHYFSS